MDPVLRDKSTVRSVRMSAVMIAMMLSLRPAYGQVSPVRQHKYRGAATVSVATLQIPEPAWKHFEKARTLALKHQTAEAERESGKALAIAPSFAAAHLLQASQQLLLREYADTIRNIAEARKSDPDVQWAGVILASAFNGLRRFDDAMTEIQALPREEAESWQAKYEESRAAIGLGDKDLALKLSAEALAEAPRDFTDAFLVRANVLIMAQHWSEAKECLIKYLATSGPKTHKDDVQRAMAMIVQHLKAEETVSLASR